MPRKVKNAKEQALKVSGECKPLITLSNEGGKRVGRELRWFSGESSWGGASLKSGLVDVSRDGESRGEGDSTQRDSDNSLTTLMKGAYHDVGACKLTTETWDEHLKGVANILNRRVPGVGTLWKRSFYVSHQRAGLGGRGELARIKKDYTPRAL